MALSLFNACLIKETTGFISSGVYALRILEQRVFQLFSDNLAVVSIEVHTGHENRTTNIYKLWWTI
jgi:hypothetical protein